jgi:hypothetical protein
VKLSPKSLLIESGVGEDIAVLLEQAIAAHVDTGRNAKVTFVVTVRTDPDSGKIKAGGRVQAILPTGDSDTITKKMPSIGLITVANDHPGQQTISNLGPHVRASTSPSLEPARRPAPTPRRTACRTSRWRSSWPAEAPGMMRPTRRSTTTR